MHVNLSMCSIILPLPFMENTSTVVGITIFPLESRYLHPARCHQPQNSRPCNTSGDPDLILSRFRSDFEPLLIRFASKPAQNRIKSGSKSDRGLGRFARAAALSWAWTIQEAQVCEHSAPLQHSKTPQTPNLFKICPDDCFSGLQSEELNFVSTLSKFVRCCSILTNF